jgi:nucleolar complex protein 2
MSITFPAMKSSLIMRTDEGEAHRMELSALAEKDPEFYKYLQENDKELLEFQTGPKPRVEQMDNDDEDVEMSEEEEDAESGDDAKAPLLTSDILRKWQKALLEVCLCPLLVYEAVV